MTDEFEKFINTCLKYYGLDPCHYFSSPGLRWDAILKMTGIELKLISHTNMHYFTEEETRGGVSYIAKRYSKANNKYMTDHESSEENKFIIYLDRNNFCGWVMSQYLPYGEFKCLNQKEIDKFDVNSIEENSSNGYILKVDLEYPDELHNSHNDYPISSRKT